MEDNQRDKLASCDRVNKFNDTYYATKLKPITEYDHEKDAFEKAYALAQKAALAQTSTVGPSKDELASVKLKMAKTTYKYALRGKIKANQLKNKTLADHLDHSISYISKASKNLAIDRATDIRDTLNNNLNILTNIKAVDTEEITGTIDDYIKIKDLPIITRQKKTAIGTNPLEIAIEEAFVHIDNMYGLVYSYFEDNDKALVDEFALAKQVINTGVTHNGVKGTVYKNGKPVAGASVKIVGTTKSAVTDADGHYSISEVKAGKYTIEASDEGGDSESKSLHVINSHTETVDFNLP